MRIISYTQPPTTSMVNGDVRKCFFFFCAGEKDDELVHTQTNGNQIHIIGLYLENHLCGFCDQQLITATTIKNQTKLHADWQQICTKTCSFVNLFMCRLCVFVRQRKSNKNSYRSHNKIPNKTTQFVIRQCVCVCMFASVLPFEISSTICARSIRVGAALRKYNASATCSTCCHRSRSMSRRFDVCPFSCSTQKHSGNPYKYLVRY